MFTNTINGFSALCSNGTLATVAMDGATPVITRSAPFFSATEDPIYDTSILDAKTGNATMLSYSGMITPVTLGRCAQDRRGLVDPAGRAYAQGRLYADGCELDAGRPSAHRRAFRQRAHLCADAYGRILERI